MIFLLFHFFDGEEREWETKKPLPPHMGQKLSSCDTTQIDAIKTPARFTRHHAYPMDNGWVPVGIYLVARSSRPQKAIRLTACRPDLTIRDSLGVCSVSYSSSSKVSLFIKLFSLENTLSPSHANCKRKLHFFRAWPFFPKAMPEICSLYSAIPYFFCTRRSFSIIGSAPSHRKIAVAAACTQSMGKPATQ